MKSIVAAIALVGMVACADNTPKEFTGFIDDATMNTVTVKALTDDQTVTFTTETADKSQAPGMLIGSPIVVTYVGKLGETTTPATKIVLDETYYEAVGQWTMADPLNDSLRMGVDIQIQGAAQSINMATMRYTGWELQGEANKILLKGTSEGSGEPIEFTQTGVMAKNADGVWTMTIDGTDTIYTKAAL